MTDTTDLREAHYNLRRTAVAGLRADLVGPVDGPEEIIDDAPTTRYVAGVLFPLEGDAALGTPDDHDVQDEGDEAVAPDPGVARLAARQPSSCGVTFAVDLALAQTIVVECGAARYVPVDDAGDVTQNPDRADYGLLRGKWKRHPAELPEVRVEVSARADMRHQLTAGLELFVRVRAPDSRGITAVTAVLRNTVIAEPGLRDLDAWLQARISVRSVGGDAVFAERRFGSLLVDDEELESYDLLYRHTRAYAVGHGCSAVWRQSEDAEHADEVATEFVPETIVKLADSNPSIDSLALSMRFCEEASKDDLIEALTSIGRDYAAWIDDIEAEASRLGDRYADAVSRHVTDCRAAAARLQLGAELLDRDGDSLRAFRLANEAMRLQRARTDWLRAGGPGDGPRDGDDGRWRPFQLAFILICLEGIARPHSGDRDVVDLLWFPTGGGKTEAYLGLIAFTIFRRRLTNADGAGVAVLMRYTLRLLTLQQFARAALLISCCERVRRGRTGLGAERISLGLWVGRGATPNTRAEARKALEEIRKGAVPADGDPRQLQACVWCGTKLRTDHYWAGDSPPRLAVSCRNKSCDFSGGLPVYLIDEDIYEYRPSLVIATIDKFASLPWNPEIGALFGIGQATPPPELIVQDELHLISGPLGTLAGLYETAIDVLCTAAGGERPKVIASTATIRRATQQVRGLFDRTTQQFPPPGIDARDSYFAVETPSDKKGDRSYVGVMAPATSQTTAMVRTYAKLLASTEQAEVEPRVKDPYWTLLGYFNSLRVLGGARMQVQDDVVDRLKLVLGAETSRHMDLIEMTSRVASADIPGNLAKMEVSLDQNADETLDVVLATNMISVGVDIDRLGLMVVMGQPQATAEYIQATSRVGRSHPGLVVVVFNAARSRDRSHYEAFQAFHGALYKQVESTSVTPFASRARDRGLHAAFVALCRMTIPALTENKAAASIEAHRTAVEQVRDTILQRVSRVDPAQSKATKRELDNLVDQWIARARHTPDLRYSDHRNPHRALLVAAGAAANPGSLPTLYSLRDVDAESSLQLI